MVYPTTRRIRRNWMSGMPILPRMEGSECAVTRDSARSRMPDIYTRSRPGEIGKSFAALFTGPRLAGTAAARKVRTTASMVLTGLDPEPCDRPMLYPAIVELSSYQAIYIEMSRHLSPSFDIIELLMIPACLSILSFPPAEGALDSKSSSVQLLTSYSWKWQSVSPKGFAILPHFGILLYHSFFFLVLLFFSPFHSGRVRRTVRTKAT